MKKCDYTAFCNNLRKLMEVRNYSCLSLAEEIECQPSTLSRYLQGLRNPDLPYVVRIAEFFGVSVDWLLGLSGDKFEVLPKEIQDISYLYTIASPDDRNVVNVILEKYRSKT